MNTVAPDPRVRLGRRLAAIVYDSLLLFAVLVLAFVPVTFLGISVERGTPTVLLWLYELAVCFLYFGWQWTRGGQTLGMKSWGVRLVNLDGGRISWSQALLRYVSALVSWAALGLGFLWSELDARNLAWHDRWSGTQLRLAPRKPTKNQ